MIDIHSHILPKVDDGSKCLSMTYEMLRRCEFDGIKEIIATPHYYGYNSINFRRVKARVSMLNKLICKKNLSVKIYHGQEVYLTYNLIKQYEKKEIGTLNDSRYMLIELDMKKFTNRMLNIIYELRIRGIVPIIAHPERNNYILNDLTVINSLIEEGCLFQLNSGSIEGKFGWKVKRQAKLLIDKNIYNFIGSDAHDNKKRILTIKNAMGIIGKKNKLYKKKFDDDSKKLLNNEEIIFKGENINVKRWYFI